jgi:hypothetical protein
MRRQPCGIDRLAQFFSGNNRPLIALALGGVQVAMAPMTDHHPRSSYELDGLPYTKETARSAVRIAIGQELKGRYKVPQELPREMLALLMRVNPPHEEKSASFTGNNSPR